MTSSEAKKPDLVAVLRGCGALLTGDFELKSGRRSPYFVDFGRIPDGAALGQLGECFARKIMSEFDPDSFDLVFGPAYKAIPIAVAAVVALARLGVNKQYAFDRKVEKTYGEKSRFIGGSLEPGTRVVIVDDVITDGGTKLEVIETLRSLPGVSVVGVVVGVDRSEGSGVVADFERRTQVQLKAICTIDDIDAHLRGPASVSN
jgi:orotate phosphoribosyltransferase